MKGIYQIRYGKNTKVSNAGAQELQKNAVEAEDIALTQSGFAIVTAVGRRT
jgi:hypothetical protein